MKFKTIWKDTFREIKKSKMRFLAISTIILLGVAFYVGISATGPDMVNSSEQYYSDLNLMDYKVQSNYGLTKDDINSLEEIDSVSVQSHYAYDFLTDDASAVRLYSLDLEKEQEINQYHIVDGRLPDKAGEIAVDNKKRLRSDLEIGDSIKLDRGESAGDPEDKLTRTEFKIVGFVNSPVFVEIESRGVASVGSGTLNFFGVIPEKNYTSDLYTEAYLKIDGSEEFDDYSEEYEEYTKDYLPKIEDKLASLEDRREESIRDEAQEEIDEGREEIQEAKDEIADAEKELSDAAKDIEEGWQDLEEGRNELQKERKNAEKEIQKNEEELKNGRRELKQNKEELGKQKDRLKEKEQELKENEKELNNGISQVKSGITEVEKGLKEINNNLPEVKSGIETIKNEQEKLETNKEEIQKALELPEVNHEELRNQIKELDKKLEQLKNQDPVNQEAIKEVEKQKTKLEEALKIPEVNHKELEEQLKEVQAGLDELNKKEKELQSQLDELNNKKAELEEQLRSLKTELTKLNQNKKELADGKNEIENGLNEIEEGFTQISQKEEEIQEAATEIEKAKENLRKEMARAEEELDDAEAELIDSEAEYQDALETFEEEKADALVEIEENEEKLDDAKEELNDLAIPDYQTFDRSDNFGYSEYKDNADRLSVIAKVFPVFFFLIAIFISFTTMTRMVDEEREYIGIMKAMGYRNRHILIKFIVYAAIATILGSILGLVIGYSLFPTLIFYAYESMYNFPEIYLQQYTLYTVIALIFAFVSTVGASLLAVRYSLQSNAARLLRPKPPKKGSRIWLEKISFIWRRLSFNYKITFRNVFRYKSRMLMTILGIAGSTGLILTGFGISDSIGDILDIQYGEINQFQAYVAIDPNVSESGLKNYEEDSLALEGTENEMFILQKTVRAKEGDSTQDITFFVPETPEELDHFVRLKSAANDEVIEEMDQSGIYLTDKIAQLLDLEIGDEFEVLNADDELWKADVVGIVENYIGHFAYMTPDYFEKITGDEFDHPDVQLLKYNKEEIDQEKLGGKLIEKDAVAGIQYVDDIYDSFAASLESLDWITQILVISAAALAFIVLYNLTNINVSERRRELSTIKVLGSYDYEVTSYIYRENIILTILGIAIGLGFGKILTNFIMETMEIDMLVFGRNIYLPSYLYASLLTILFSLVVMLVIHFQLKKIDMVEALKGND